MENKQKIYLDKVVEFLVRDTRIDYDKDEIQFPFFYSRFLMSRFSIFSLSVRLKLFSEYCKEVYGLTEDEVKYVWNQYKDIILDKITNK